VIGDHDGEEIHRGNAVYVGPDVLAGPEPARLAVPPLEPGTYWLEWDSNPDMMHAWLVIE
jgi:hypothetical protein